MGVLSFNAWGYAAAGAALATAPLIIHLLNRRHYRVVQWAAMDFLRQAIVQSRRILQIRDILLLILRTVAVLLFGLALARPYFALRQEHFDPRQPLHAVIVIDNSLSMAYQSLDGTLLDKAKDRARQLVDQLPSGSHISIIAACGSREPLSSEPYESKESATEALDRIRIVDRSATISRAVNDARSACEAAPQLAKRIFFISDQQLLNWHGARLNELLGDLPPLQVISVEPSDWENTWIADLRVQDGLANLENPSKVIVELGHSATAQAAPRRDVLVTLRAGDIIVGEKTVAIEAASTTRQVDFDCNFAALIAPTDQFQLQFVTLRASITPDRLEADDERWINVPVAADLGVVFIDQYATDEEDPAKGRLGETRHLRKLLAAGNSRRTPPAEAGVGTRHITPPQLTQESLASARLVVIAGLRDPGMMVGLLRDYVRQGGQLLIAAGADFDPAAWNDAAWLHGNGILPLPLSPESFGSSPEAAADKLMPFSLAADTLATEPYFRLPGISEEELRDLYGEPLFFKAVLLDASAPTIEAWKRGELSRLEMESNLLAEIHTRRVSLTAKGVAGELTVDDRRALRDDEERLRVLKPVWLSWAASDPEQSADEPLPSDPALRQSQLESLVRDRSPRVLGRYDLPSRPPFIAARKIGRGEVVFCSTGLLSSWNTLPKTNSILLFDRILQGLIQNTMPRRNSPPTERLALPLPHEEQSLQLTLTRPGSLQTTEALDVGYIAGQQRGVILSALLERGIYRVTGVRPPLERAPTSAAPVWNVSIAVNGDPAESDLTPLSRQQFDDLAVNTNVHWVSRGESFSLAGGAASGQSSWWWLAATVLLLLVLEMSVLAWPTLRPTETVAPHAL